MDQKNVLVSNIELTKPELKNKLLILIFEKNLKAFSILQLKIFKNAENFSEISGKFRKKIKLFLNMTIKNYSLTLDETRNSIAIALKELCISIILIE